MSTRGALQQYVRAVEPLRRAVNSLLERADPILGAFHEHSITPAQAAERMGLLERRFAAYTVEVSAIRSRSGTLRALNAGYADTYVYEDAYLSDLALGLGENRLSDLPNAEELQRVALIRWRTRLTVLARSEHVKLPSDLQRAGRGEIRPSPTGS